MELTLITLTLFGEERQVFRSSDAAREHMVHHLLTAPECEAWRLVLPEVELGERLQEREWQARQLLEEAGQGQALYEAYARAIGRAIQDGGALGLCWRGGRQAWMGLEGVVVIEQERPERCVLTAYIPRDLKNRSNAAPTHERPLPREEKIKNWTVRSTSDQERRNRATRQRQHYTKERLIFLSFCEAVVALQTIQNNAVTKRYGEAGGQRDAETLLPIVKALGMEKEERWLREWKRSRHVIK
jgi:hypothetical protein